MPRANPQQDKKYYSYDPRQTHSDFHNKIGQKATSVTGEYRRTILCKFWMRSRRGETGVGQVKPDDQGWQVIERRMLTVSHLFENRGPGFRGYQQERQTFREDQPSDQGDYHR